MDQTNVRDSVECGNAHFATEKPWVKPSPISQRKRGVGERRGKGGVRRRLEGGMNASAPSRMSSRLLTASNAHLRLTCDSLASTARRLLFLGETQRATGPGGYLARLVFTRREASTDMGTPLHRPRARHRSVNKGGGLTRVLAACPPGGSLPPGQKKTRKRLRCRVSGARRSVAVPFAGIAISGTEL